VIVTRRRDVIMVNSPGFHSDVGMPNRGTTSLRRSRCEIDCLPARVELGQIPE
jgi:hypothetical protein